MIFTLHDRTLKFSAVAIEFGAIRSGDLFGKKNNKALGQTLLHPKYSPLAPIVIQAYPDHLGRRLGDFLMELKAGGDPLYRRFLNRYGDACYSQFRLLDSKIRKLKGLYCFTTNSGRAYIGRSTDTFARRIDKGYGQIHPKNCYRDGQVTNCHLNALIARDLDEVALFIYPMINNDEICTAEAALIAQENPAWNIQLKD